MKYWDSSAIVPLLVGEAQTDSSVAPQRSRCCASSESRRCHAACGGGDDCRERSLDAPVCDLRRATGTSRPTREFSVDGAIVPPQRPAHFRVHRQRDCEAVCRCAPVVVHAASRSSTVLRTRRLDFSRSRKIDESLLEELVASSLFRREAETRAESSQASARHTSALSKIPARVELGGRLCY